MIPHLDRCNYRVHGLDCNCRDLLARLECAEPQDFERPGAELLPLYRPPWAEPERP